MPSNITKSHRQSAAQDQSGDRYLAQNPHHGIHIKKLRGVLSHLYRYRIGDARILYEIHEEDKTVRVVTIDDRGGVYK